MDNTQEIVTVNLTTNGETPSGETLDIIIDADKIPMVNGQSLYRKVPNQALMIVRDPKGNFLQRHEKNGIGVSLASYLFGKIHMRRKDPEAVDDYTLDAFKDSGSPAAIRLLKTPSSTRAVGHLYLTEYLQEKAHREEMERQKSKRKIKRVADNAQTDVQHQDLASLQALRDANKKAKVGTTLTCPQCGTKFVKKQWQEIFCSSYKRPGPDGRQCKTTFDGRIEALQQSQPITKPSAVKQPKQPSTPVYEDNTRGVVFKMKNGNEMHIDADTFLNLDRERLKILVGQ